MQPYAHILWVCKCTCCKLVYPAYGVIVVCSSGGPDKKFDALMKRARAQQEAQDKANAALQASKAATMSMLIPDATVDWTKFRYLGIQNQSMALSVCTSLCVCMCSLSVCLYGCVCVSICLFVCATLSVLSVCMAVSLSVYVSVCLSAPGLC